MVTFRSCPRCKGDIQMNEDQYGPYNECLQCGYVVNVDQVRPEFVIEKGRQAPGRPKKIRGSKSAA